MTVVRRVERCPDHDIPASFAFGRGDQIIDTWCGHGRCQRFGIGKSEPAKLRLPLVDPPEVVEP